MGACLSKFGFPFSLEEFALSIQHLFVIFGPTVLVPLLTGMNPSVALITAGIGTLLFHLLTKGIVPVFQSSSFAYITVIENIIANHDDTIERVQLVQGGIILSGIFYGIVSFSLYFTGVEKLKKSFPPEIIGSLTIVIGAGLSFSAVNDMFGLRDLPDSVNSFYYKHQYVSWLISLLVLFLIVYLMVFGSSTLKHFSIVLGLLAGYGVCWILKAFSLETVDISQINSAAWINLPYGSYYLPPSKIVAGIFQFPKFDILIMLSILPISLVTFTEHFGQVNVAGRVIGRDLIESPGLHRTMLGDGIATIVAGFLGGPANNVYVENTGLLVTTKRYNPKVFRLTSLFLILLGFLGKFGAVLMTIPAPVKGAVSIVLFGMITSSGIRIILDANINLTSLRNLIVIALVIGLGLGINTATYDSTKGLSKGIQIPIQNSNIGISGLFIATVVGMFANGILPINEDLNNSDDSEYNYNQRKAKVGNHSQDSSTSSEDELPQTQKKPPKRDVHIKNDLTPSEDDMPKINRKPPQAVHHQLNLTSSDDSMS